MIPEHVARAHSSISTNDDKWQMRYGCIPARIGAPFIVKTSVPYQARNHHGVPVGVLRPGQSVSLVVRDTAGASPEARAVARWVCKHPSCKNQHWETKEDLLADPDHRSAALHQNQETHVYFAIAEVAHVPAKPAKRDAEGNVLEEAVPPAGFIELFSDEA